MTPFSPVSLSLINCFILKFHSFTLKQVLKPVPATGFECGRSPAFKHLIHMVCNQGVSELPAKQPYFKITVVKLLSCLEDVFQLCPECCMCC